MISKGWLSHGMQYFPPTELYRKRSSGNHWGWIVRPKTLPIRNKTVHRTTAVAKRNSRDTFLDFSLKMNLVITTAIEMPTNAIVAKIAVTSLMSQTQKLPHIDFEAGIPKTKPRIAKSVAMTAVPSIQGRGVIVRAMRRLIVRNKPATNRQ
jgi:hypothetical protein